MGVSLTGDTLTFQFPQSAEIFAQRVSAPDALAGLREAAAKLLRRKVLARVETVAVPAGVAVGGDEQAAERPTGPPPEAAVSSPGPAPADGSAGATDLRQRAEQEPLVQEMLKALKGQIVSVEEM